MKKIMLPFATVLLFALATFAQTTATPDSTPGAQGTQSSSPSMQQTPSNDTGMSGASNSEKKIKGCVAQENGQYVLQTKHGKSVPLSGQDVSAHVGHTVALHGTWAGTAAAGSQTSTGMASGNSFDVTKVDMISDSCKTKGNMSTGSNGTTPQQ
jgi:hypothetical protein